MFRTGQRVLVVHPDFIPLIEYAIVVCRVKMHPGSVDMFQVSSDGMTGGFLMKSEWLSAIPLPKQILD